MEIYNFLVNNLSFSFKPLAAIVLWGIPLIISGLFTIRWRVLQGISGAVAQIIGTYLVLVIVFEYVLGLFGILTYGYALLAFSVLLVVTLLTTPRGILASLWNIEKWLDQGREKMQVISADLKGFVWFVLIIGLIYLAIAVHKLFSPPLSIDCLWASLPQIVGWLQTHSIFEHSAPLSFYHSNSKLLTLWTIIPFGTDQFINLTNLPASLLAATAIYHLLRIFELNRKLSILGGLAFLSLPYVAHWMWNQKPEILLTAFFVLSLCFVMEYFKRQNVLGLIYGLCCAGLVAGTKTFGMYYGLLVYLAIIVFCVVDKRYRKWTWLLLGSIVCLIFALEWPVRNWIIWGNPFYPMDISIFGHCLFPGPGKSGKGLSSTLSTSIAANIQPRYIPFLFKGAFLAFGFVGLLSLIILPFCILGQVKMKMGRIYLFLFIITVGSYICYMFIPYTADTVPGRVGFLKRSTDVYYAMPFFATAVIVLIIFVSYMKSHFSRILEFVLLIQIIHGILINTIRCASFVSGSLIMLTEGLIISGFFFYLICQFIARRYPKILWVAMAGGILLLSLIGGLGFKPAQEYKIHKRSQNDLFSYFTAMSPDLLTWVEKNISNKTINVCPLEPGYGILPYSLYGTKLNNKIISGPQFLQIYEPPSNIDIVVVSGKKQRDNNNLKLLPPWTENWGKNIGFRQVFSNGVQCVYARK